MASCRIHNIRYMKPLRSKIEIPNETRITRSERQNYRSSYLDAKKMTKSDVHGTGLTYIELGWLINKGTLNFISSLNNSYFRRKAHEIASTNEILSLASQRDATFSTKKISAGCTCLKKLTRFPFFRTFFFVAKIKSIL